MEFILLFKSFMGAKWAFYNIERYLSLIFVSYICLLYDILNLVFYCITDL